MKKLLVVDDDLFVLATLELGLKKAGYTVFKAECGEKALQIADAEKPDLAILDMNMPGMDGLAVARTLRERGEVPYIFLSAFSDDDVVWAAASAGALGYLVKPLEIARIVPAIEVALMRHEEATALQEYSANLAVALNANREIDVAIGLLMERYKADRASAFSMMRSYARSQRCKIAEVAQKLLAGEQIDLLASREISPGK